MFAVLLLIRRRAWWPAVLAFVWVVVLSALALAVFRTDPRDAWEAISYNWSTQLPEVHDPTARSYIVEPCSNILVPLTMYHSSSLWTAVRTVIFVVKPAVIFPPDLTSLRVALVATEIAGGALLLLLAAAITMLPLRTWELLLLVVVGMIVATPMSNDYKLIYLYLPLLFFMRTEPGLLRLVLPGVLRRFAGG